MIRNSKVLPDLGLVNKECVNDCLQASCEICPICDQPLFFDKHNNLVCYCGHTEPKLAQLLTIN